MKLLYREIMIEKAFGNRLALLRILMERHNNKINFSRINNDNDRNYYILYLQSM